MPKAKPERFEGYPSITAREHWGKYASGMVAETLFTLGMTGIGLLLAVVAMAIWR
jgi:hypothetical protein